jgi:hypothetical protein
MKALSPKASDGNVSVQATMARAKRALPRQLPAASETDHSTSISRSTVLHRMDTLHAPHLDPSSIPKKADRLVQSSSQSATVRPDLNVEGHLRRLVERMADDLHPQLAQGSRLLASTIHRLTSGAPLSRADLHWLQGEAQRLAMLAAWSDTAELYGFVAKKSLPLVRRRFAASDLRDAFAESLSYLCAVQGVRLIWEGWNSTLPNLYLDPRWLLRAIENIVASLALTAQASDSIKIKTVLNSPSSEKFKIDIEAPRSHISWETARLVNGSRDWLPTKLCERGFLAGKHLTALSGGRLSAVQSGGKGTVFQIAVPTANPRSIVASWSMQLAGSLPNSNPHRIHLFALRCQSGNDDRVNSLLQQHANKRQLVIRISSNRWLIADWRAEQRASRSPSAGGQLAADPMRNISALLATVESEMAAPPSMGLNWLSHHVYHSKAFTPKEALIRSAGGRPLAAIVDQLSLKITQLVQGQRLIVEPLISETRGPSSPAHGPMGSHPEWRAGSHLPGSHGRLLESLLIGNPAVSSTAASTIKQWKSCKAGWSTKSSDRKPVHPL